MDHLLNKIERSQLSGQRGIARQIYRQLVPDSRGKTTRGKYSVLSQSIQTNVELAVGFAILLDQTGYKPEAKKFLKHFGFESRIPEIPSLNISYLLEKRYCIGHPNP